MAKMEIDDADPFEWAVMRMVEMYRKKRADYATPGNIFMNFEVNAAMMRLEGYDRKEDCLSMVCRKVNRITNLRGRDPQNETVVDSYEDLAVYATLLLAMALEEAFPLGIGTQMEKVVTGTTAPPGVAMHYVSPSSTEPCFEPGHLNCAVINGNHTNPYATDRRL